MRRPAAALLALFALPVFATDPLANLRPGHPRLLVTTAAATEELAAAKTDPLRAALHAYLLRTAEAHRAEPPISHTVVGGRLLDESRKAIAHVLTSAMAYRLTGDERFARFAIDTMLRAAAFPDWNPSHFLDVAEMATALALGYDWLHARLTPAERTTVKRALLDHALVWARPAYARAEPHRRSFPFVRGNLHNNWNQVCNGGFLLASLAIADEEPALAREVIAGVRATLPYAMAAYVPDGAYPEGPVYWGYGTRYTVYLLAALESALGRDFGLGDSPAFDRTALYRLHMASPIGHAFNYADGKSRLGADDCLTWLARRYRHPHALTANRRWLEQLLREPPNDETSRFVALHAVWFPTIPTAAERADLDPLPLDAHFRGPSQLAVFRSSWEDPHAVWVGFKAGSNAVNHAHLDLGTFTLDAEGVRWAIDLGRDDYNLPGYWDRATVRSPRWQYFRLNNHGHNTLTPGDRLQEPSATAPILRSESRRGWGFAIADLTAAYPGAARQLHRGLALLERSRVLVQDDASGVTPGVPLTWRMLTAATVTLDSPRRAVLTTAGRTLHIELLSPAEARFTSHPATPPTAAENPNHGITVLETGVPAADQPADARIAVLLSPVGEKWPVRPPPAVLPLSQWP
jgi:hypothetical protein